MALCNMSFDSAYIWHLWDPEQECKWSSMSHNYIISQKKSYINQGKKEINEICLITYFQRSEKLDFKLKLLYFLEFSNMAAPLHPALYATDCFFFISHPRLCPAWWGALCRHLGTQSTHAAAFISFVPSPHSPNHCSLAMPGTQACAHCQ